MFSPPPPDSPDMDSPPPGSPDMDFPDDLDGPPDDFPDDVDGPPDDNIDPPPPEDDLDFPNDDLDFPNDDVPPPPDDDMPPPTDNFSEPSNSPVAKIRKASTVSPPPDLPDDMDLPPDDTSFGPSPGDEFDDMGMPPPPDDFSLPSLPPSSPGPSKSKKSQNRSSLGSLGAPPSDFGSIDDDMPPPPDFPDETSLPPPDDDLPPPMDSDGDSVTKTPGLPTKIAPRKAPMRPSTSSNRPLRSSLNSSTADILSEGLAIKQPNQLQRTARIGGHDLGLNEFKLSREKEDLDSPSAEEDSTLKSTAIETRPKLVRKGKGGKPPTKFKNMMSEITMEGLDDDSLTASDSKSYSTDDPLNDKPFMSIPPVDYTSRRSSTRRSVLVNGEEFSLLQGKFEGDNFEELMVRIINNTLCIKTEADPNVLIPFDLLTDAKIHLDPTDNCVFTLTQAGSIITFKTPDPNMLKDLLSRVPPSAIQQEKPTDNSSVSSEQKKSGTHIPFADTSPGSLEEKPRQDTTTAKSPYMTDFNFDEEFYQYESGMLKADELTDASPSHEKNQKSKQKPKVKPTTVVGKVSLRDTRPNLEDSVLMLTRVKGYDRKELVDTHLQKPKLSIRRMKQICKWMTSLNVWPRPIELPTLYKEICNGLLLAKIMATVASDSQYLHINNKALTKKAALENLEQALGVIWRSKCVNNYRIPTSLEIYNGNTAKICIMMQEIFEVYVLKPLYAIAPKMFKWYHNILKQYGVPLPEEIFSQGDLINLWSHMQSGFDLFCVIYHLYGPVTIGEGLNIVRIDSLRIISNPGNILDYRANMIYIFSLLKALDIKIIWDVDDWITYPDTEFLVLQLSYIYEGLKNRQCSLPPAQGTNAGVTSGPNGEPMVTGMIFADTPTSSNRGYHRKKRTVLLGSGHDALPVLPIDTSGDADGYFRMICPPGLVSTNIKIVHSSIEVKGQRAVSERSKWNSSAAMDEIHDRLSGSRQLEILKSSHVAFDSKLSKSNSESPKRDQSQTENDDMKTIKAKLVQDMESLEQAMLDSNKEMEELEEELANRYIELEGLSGVLGPVEYNSRLNYLEKERLLLEEQRYKMQEHFSLRLLSLKERHAEAGNRLLSSKKSSNVSGYNQSSNSSIRSKSRVDKEAEQAKLHRAERGWNNYSKRQDTHNYALGRGKVAASSTFMSIAQTSLWNANVDNAIMNKTGSLISPAGKGYASRYGNRQKDVNAMWNQFKNTLKAETIKWASARSSKHGNKIMELLNQKTTISTINKAPTITTATVHSRSTRIPVKNPQNNASPEPENSSQSFAENIGTKIRREELELMQFEETRRYLVIQEKLSSYGTQYQEQQRSPRKTVSLSQPASTPKVPQYNPFQGASQYQSVSLSPEPSLARSKSQMTPSRTPQSANFVPFQTPEFSKQASLTRQASSNSMNVPGSPVVNAKNFDAIISWLAFPRYVFLKDRHTKQEYTIVIDSEIIDTKNQEIFVLKWFEINPRDRNATSGPILDDRSVLKGYVYLQDITNIQLNGKNNKDGSNILILQLSSAARALKSSGGRTVLCLEFASESESSKYYQGIQSLQSYKRQNTAGKGGQ